jgi:cytochrome-b5 reductase
MVARAYTPITLDSYDKGHFDLVVKRYRGGEFSERFHRYTAACDLAAAAGCLLPAAGQAHPDTRFGLRMKVGDTMDFRGPVTTLNYEPNAARCLGMVAGGTGITPMYQIIRTVLSNPVRKPPTIQSTKGSCP